MGANFGIIRSLNENIRDKKEKYRKLSEKSYWIFKKIYKRCIIKNDWENKILKKSIKNFIFYLEFEENKKIIQSFYKKDLNNFLEYLNKKKLVTLDKLDELVIKEYLTELKAADLSNSTYNRRLSSIKKFYKYLINNNLKEKGKEIFNRRYEEWWKKSLNI